MLCEKHKDDYTGETDRAMKMRGYEHKIITHKESEESHSIKVEKEEVVTEPETTRRSTRNTKRLDYKALDRGENIVMNEGTTEVLKHMAQYDHEKGEVTIKAITYDTNWFTREIREAIEIRKRKPTLNADEGRYHIKPIYDNILKNTKKKEEEVTEETNISNHS